MIKNAVIAGHDGNIWASSSGFNVSLVSKSATGKIPGREQSIAWKGFNFWRAYEPSCAPVTAFVMREMWHRIRARNSREVAEARVGGEASSQLPNLRLSWELPLWDPSRNLLFSFHCFTRLKSNQTQYIHQSYRLQSTLFVCRSFSFHPFHIYNLL